MLALSRRVPRPMESSGQGKWDRKRSWERNSRQNPRQSVGLGRIGQELPSEPSPFKCASSATSLPSPRTGAKLGIKRVETVRDMLPDIDYLTSTRRSRPKPTTDRQRSHRTDETGVRLINAARGGIYNEEALVEAKSGKLGGVALTSFSKNPVPTARSSACPTSSAHHTSVPGTEEPKPKSRFEAVELPHQLFHKGRVRHAVNMAASTPNARIHPAAISISHTAWAWLMASGIPPARAPATHLPRDLTQKNTKLVTAVFCPGLLERPRQDVQHRQRPTSVARTRIKLLKNRAPTRRVQSSMSSKSPVQTRENRRQRHAVRQWHAR